MVDSTEATESKFLNADIVKNSKTKKLVLTGQGEYVEGKFGNKLEVPVEIDGRPKIWSINKDSAINLREAYGTDTKSWIGYVIDLKIVKIQNKDCIIAFASQEKAKA